MKIIVTGTEKEYPEGTTVEQLIEAENVEMPLYVTVAINDEFVLTADRMTRTLKDGDTVEFLYFMGAAADGFLQ